MCVKFAVLALMLIFYVAYFAKQIMLKKQGIATMILGKGNKPNHVRWLEIKLQTLTFAMPVVEIASIVYNKYLMPTAWQWAGVAIASLGVLFFILGMTEMRSSWRAGIPDNNDTELVTSGVYRISRNPAFVGFDLMYLGILLAFPNVYNGFFSVCALVLFHKQILNEERFLEKTFAHNYVEYKSKVRRYIGVFVNR